MCKNAIFSFRSSTFRYYSQTKPQKLLKCLLCIVYINIPLLVLHTGKLDLFWSPFSASQRAPWGPTYHDICSWQTNPTTLKTQIFQRPTAKLLASKQTQDLHNSQSATHSIWSLPNVYFPISQKDLHENSIFLLLLLSNI